MGAQLPAVAVDGCHVVGTLNFDVLLFALGGVGQIDLVSTDTPPVVVAAVLAVESVLGMGQSDAGKRLALLCEAGLGQKRNIAHDDCSPFGDICVT